MVAFQGQQRTRGPPTVQEGRKKILKTVEWYNKNGNLSSEIVFQDVRTTLFAIEPHKALQILKGLEDKAASIRNPTQWIKKAAERDVPELAPKVGKTLNWYNKQGKLKQEIEWDAVRPLLATLPQQVALEVLKGLDGKEESINDPTAWIVTAAERHIERLGDEVLRNTWSGEGEPSWSGGGTGRSSWRPSAPKGRGKGRGASVGTEQSFEDSSDEGASGDVVEGTALDVKVLKAIAWYNHNGGLQQQISVKEVAPSLGQLPPDQGARIVHGLNGKGPSIRDPTWWLIQASKRQLS